MIDTSNETRQSCTVFDTPETDGEWNRIACYDHPHFENALAEFARKLERERDELLADNKHFENQNKVLTVQRDEALRSCHIWQQKHLALVQEVLK